MMNRRSLSHTFVTLALTVTAPACAHAPSPAPAPRAVPVASGSIYIDDAPGGKTPIVFIHGIGGSSEQWREQLAFFRARGRRAVALDLPGFGRSTPPSDFALPTIAAAVDAAVTRAGLTHFIIVGHSYGGAVVATYVAAHPDKVAGVVYVDAAASALPLTAEQKAQFGAALRANKMAVVHAWFGPMLGPSGESVKQEVIASAEHASADALVGAFMSLSSYDARMLISAFHGPRLAIVAADLEQPASFQKQFPEVRTIRIAGAGHWLMLDKPGEVNSALEEFAAAVH
jgi:pimeloyl-ACP methyl ester carboxylesterase